MGTRSILVVDDEEEFLACCVAEIGESALTHAVTSSRDALRVVAHERLDLVIVDLVLGPEDPGGYVLVREIKRIKPKLKVLLWSRSATIEVAVSGMRAKADDVKLKPLPLRSVLHWLDTGEWRDAEPTLPLDHATSEYCWRVLSDCGGNLSKASRRLKISRATLRRHLGLKNGADVRALALPTDQNRPV
jgi:DNA-binding NtrC family response regulator